MNLQLSQLLLRGIRISFGLLLLTPLVVTTETAFPHVLGKAVYSRALIEIIVLLWVPLALVDRSCRPQRSWLLLLLFGTLATAILAAALGVSPQRSVWSSYQRMDGVVGMAHWVALAFVLGCVLRSQQEWRPFLNLSVGSGLALALVVVAASLGIEVPFFGSLEERDLPRLGGPLGNATFLGTFCSVNAILALGLLVQSFHAAAEGPQPAGGGLVAWLWGKRLFWLVSAALSLWALGLSGSRGASLGLVAAALVICVLYAGLKEASKATRAARISAGLVALLIAVLAALPVAPERTWRYDVETHPFERLLHVDLDATSFYARWRTWQIGLLAFAERPAFGVGPENYGVAYGKHVGAEGTDRLPADRAHNHLVEKAATEGAVGLLAHLAIWFCIFRVFLLATKGLSGREWVLPAFAGAALLGDFVQDLLLIDSHSNRLQSMMLLAFAVGVERRVCPPERWPATLSRAGAALQAACDRTAVRGTCVLAAAVVCGAGLFANVRAYESGRAMGAALLMSNEASPPAWRMRAVCGAYDRAIAHFEPLANFPRRMVFAYLAAGEHESNWVRFRALDHDAAGEVLASVDAHAEAAVQTEPDNWRVHRLLARLYGAIAITEARYQEAAARYAMRFAELAPAFDIDANPEWQRPEGQ